MSRRPPLPIDALLPEMLSSLRQCPSLVIEAPPGAGKTTRVPAALLGAIEGDILVLEPRRIAARLAARRVAWEQGEEPGETVGYQVRFEERVGPRTRLRFLTEGILHRRMLTDPLLKGVGAVVLDEFHERHLDSDLALALLKRLQQQRPALHLLIMSATLDAAPIARYLGHCPILRSDGRQYPLTVRNLPYSPHPLHVQLRSAVELLLAERPAGHILAFLPGAAEIRRAQRECAALCQAARLLVLPLYGDLSPAEQDHAIAPSAARKLILATNLAESSVTVEGVSAVIDSGLARSAAYSAWTGLPTLQINRISKASAAQRAGRAGRTGPGQVLRMYTAEDFALRPEQDTPEIGRADLAQLLLTLRALKIEDPGQLDWLTPPPAEAVASATALLDRLGAAGAMAQRLARLPLPPRLSRMVVEATDRGVGHDGCRAAAMLSLGLGCEKSDLLAAMDAPSDPRVQQHTQQLVRLSQLAGRPRHDDDALLHAVLAGFPDRVVKQRIGNQVLLSNGLSAEVSGAAPAYPFLVALDAEDRLEHPMPLLRLTARVEPEWLLDLFPDHVQERATLQWNHTAERVERSSALVYDKLVIEETNGPATGPEAAELLARKALEAGIGRFVDTEALDHFVARAAFAGLAVPPVDEAVREASLGLQSFSDLRKALKSLPSLLEAKLDVRLLHDRAPLSVRLHGGRQVRIHYQQGKPPWIASRLQDFFGMQDTPRIGADRTPLVVHLLAPNQRAVQTTTDLAGFWQRLYPQVRRELMRRYPRHAWPEQPTAAYSPGS